MRVLVVTNPCLGRNVGDRITDPDEIAEILAGEHAHHHVQAEHEDVQKPSKTSK